MFVLSIAKSVNATHLSSTLQSIQFQLFHNDVFWLTGGMYGVPPLMDRYGLALPMAPSAMVGLCFSFFLGIMSCLTITRQST